MKNEVKVALCIGLFFLGVLGGYFGFKYFNNKENSNNSNNQAEDKKKDNNALKEDNQSSSNEEDKTGTELDELLTLEKITTLAKDEHLYLEKKYDTETLLMLSDMDLTLKIDNGKLKLVGNNKTWKVTDIDEKVIAMELEHNDCDINVMRVLFLTEKGNLYRLYKDEKNNIMYNGQYDVKDSFLKELNIKNEVKLGLVKLNGTEKVQAISTLTKCQAGATCGGCETVVYMANGEYRYARENLKDKYIQN